MFEEEMLKLWLQCLTFTSNPFSFCTGAIRSRSVNSIPLDVQVISRSVIRDVVQSVARAQIIVAHDIGAHGEDVSWARSLVLDVAGVDKTQVRDYILRAAKSRTRREVGELARIHHAVVRVESNSLPIGSLIEEMATIYPKPDQGVAAKALILGAPDDRMQLTCVDDAQLMSAIIETGLSSSFDLDALNFTERLSAAWPAGRSVVLGTLLHLADCESESNSRIIQTVLGRHVALEDADQLVRFSDGVILDVLQRRPNLLASRTLWARIAPTDLAPTLEKHVGELSTDVLVEILKILLESSVDRFARLMANALGDAFVHQVLDWFSNSDDQNPEANWWNEVFSHSGAMCEWLDHHPAASPYLVARLVSAMSPDSRDLQKCSLETWAGFSEAAAKELGPSARNKFLSFVLVFSFKSSQEAAAGLAAIAFPVIYRATAQRSFAPSESMELDRLLPNGFYWNDCYRLRVALVSSFSKYNWSTKAFLQSTSDAELLDDILGTWGWDERETSFLRRVVDESLAGSCEVSDAQLGVLKRYAKHFL